MHYNENKRRVDALRPYKHTLKIIGPIILVALLLLGACATAAMYLYKEQARTADLLRENVGSRRVSRELEMAMEDLLVLFRTGNIQVAGLHERLRQLLTESRTLADKEEEVQLVSQLEQSFNQYDQRWASETLSETTRRDRLSDAIRMIETDMMPACRRLGQFNSDQIERSEEVHGRSVKLMAWGLVGAGSVGAVAGVLLGYGVARGLRRSIYQLSVRIKDAADRLGQDLPTVTLAHDGDFSQLHTQVQRLMMDIEGVVQELQEREREVRRAEQMGAVGQLAAGAAHELRNPLTAIKMLIQAYREDANECRLPLEDLDVIVQEVRRMERCLNTFLDFARPPKPEQRPFDLVSVIARTFALLGARARHQQVALKLVADRPLLIVEADAEQIQQVLVNLLLNALDAMPEGGSIEVRLHVPAAGWVELQVCDTGPGISPELGTRLFEPFVSNKETGLGLGLVVSRRIIEAHGGCLECANATNGGGACFHVRFPAGKNADERQANHHGVTHSHVASH